MDSEPGNLEIGIPGSALFPVPCFLCLESEPGSPPNQDFSVTGFPSNQDFISGIVRLLIWLPSWIDEL